MVVGDVLRFVVHGDINAQAWENTHFYQVDDLSQPLSEGQFGEIVQAFATWYLTNVHAYMKQITPTTMFWRGVRGENLFNVAELGAYTYAPSVTGDETSQPLAQFNAYAWAHTTGRRDMNGGSRRMPGVVESFVGLYGAVDSAAVTQLDNAATSFSTDVALDFSGGLGEVTLRPVVVKRVRSGEGTTESPYQYRLPRTTAERVTYTTRDWRVVPFITTQNTRKTGRGI